MSFVILKEIPLLNWLEKVEVSQCWARISVGWETSIADDTQWGHKITGVPTFSVKCDINFDKISNKKIDIFSKLVKNEIKN